MNAVKVWWFLVSLCAAFPLLCIAAITIDCQHFGGIARSIHDLWESGEQ